MLDALVAVGVGDIVVVIGYLGEQIREAVAGRQGVCTIFNPEYRKGAVVSLWRARDYFDDDLLIMDADVLFPADLLRRLVESPRENCFLMDAAAANDGSSASRPATPAMAPPPVAIVRPRNSRRSVVSGMTSTPFKRHGLPQRLLAKLEDTLLIRPSSSAWSPTKSYSWLQSVLG